MYCLVVRYDMDRILIGENLGEVGKSKRIWNLNDEIFEDNYQIIPEKIKPKLEKLIGENPNSEFYEILDKEIYGGPAKFYLIKELRNPIKEDSEEKSIAEKLIEYYKKIIG